VASLNKGGGSQPSPFFFSHHLSPLSALHRNLLMKDFKGFHTGRPSSVHKSKQQRYMNIMYPTSWRKLMAVMAFLAVSICAQALTFYFPANAGVMSDYAQYDVVTFPFPGTVSGITGPAVDVQATFGPPYQVSITVNTTGYPPGTYVVASLNGSEDITVVLY
jgi:hypothetical protein